MAALMIIYMNITDDSWMESYFAEVPKLLAEYGAETIAGSRHIMRIEGAMPEPDRMAVLRFPSIDAIERFMADERYQPWRQERQRGAAAEIFVFDNAVKHGELA